MVLAYPLTHVPTTAQWWHSSPMARYTSCPAQTFISECLVHCSVRNRRNYACVLDIFHGRGVTVSRLITYHINPLRHLTKLVSTTFETSSNVFGRFVSVCGQETFHQREYYRLFDYRRSTGNHTFKCTKQLRLVCFVNTSINIREEKESKDKQTPFPYSAQC